MRATEGLAHLGTEFVRDVVACNPAAGALPFGDGARRGVRLAADDHDPSARVHVMFATTATREVGTVDDDEIRLKHLHVRSQVMLDHGRLPTPVLAFEQLDNQATHGRVGHGDQHAWRTVTDWAGAVTAHAPTVPEVGDGDIRLNYGAALRPNLEAARR